MEMNDFRTRDHCVSMPQGQIRANYDETGFVTRC